jgi:hypothetical protein
MFESRAEFDARRVGRLPGRTALPQYVSELKSHRVEAEVT